MKGKTLAQRNWSGTKSALEESRTAMGSRTGVKVSADEGMRAQPSTRTRGGNK